MHRRGGWVNAFAFVGLLAAASAAVPAVRWCPIRWDQVQPAAYLRCDAGLPPLDGRCPAPAAATDVDPASAPAGSQASACDMAPAAPQSKTLPRGRAYCLGDPAIARGLLSRAPRLHASDTFEILPAPTVSEHRPAPRFASRTWVAEARPPTHHQASLPPVRAPPREA